MWSGEGASTKSINGAYVFILGSVNPFDSSSNLYMWMKLIKPGIYSG